MSKRMKNKRVKRMICGILERKSSNQVRFIDGNITIFLDYGAFKLNQGVVRFDASMNVKSKKMTSLIVSAVGSTIISISECNPATFDQSGFEELEFTEIGLASELKVE